MATDAGSEIEKTQHIGMARYLIVYVALLALTVTTYLASRLEFGGGGPIAVLVALGIATIKSALVAMFFMHLWDHAGANRLVLLAAIVFVVLLTLGVLGDVAFRFPLALPNMPAAKGLVSTQAVHVAVPASPPPQQPMQP